MIPQPSRFGTIAMIWGAVLGLAFQAVAWMRLAARLLGAL